MRAHWTLILAVVLYLIAPAQAGIRADLSGDAVVDFATTMDLPLMTVGNPGNTGELSGAGAGGYGPDRICGAVDYVYNIGKFEVTAGQYTEFLNAVAATDTYELYDSRMAYSACRIERSGSQGSFTYSVVAEWADRPINYVGWGDAARFANWLTNGMPTGAQDLTTTEDGVYLLNGAMTKVTLQAVVRRELRGWGQYVIPTEDEWYKAAYHKNDGVTGNYFDYPTGTDAVPSNDLIDPDPGNNATFYDNGRTDPHDSTEVGEFENSPSPYGTFDMGGNVWEWNETVLAVAGPAGSLRGGCYTEDSHTLAASDRGHGMTPVYQYYHQGFRVAEVPEPTTLFVMAAAGLPLLLKRKRKSRA